MRIQILILGFKDLKSDKKKCKTIIALIPSPSIRQMLANFSGVEF